MSTIKVAEALLLRKQLEAKVKQLEQLKLAGENGVYKEEVSRRSISDNVDEIIAKVPRVSIASITAAYDHYANALRKIDGRIQEANWTNTIESDYQPYTEKTEE